MEGEQWSHRDFTQIKPRRPEGPAVCEEDWQSVPFSFLWPLGRAANGEQEEGGVQDFDKRGHDKDARIEKRFMASDEVQEQEEFEFSSMSTASTAVVERLCHPGISPADELFFKGQLLPLHLPPRIQMVKKLSLDKHQHQEQLQQQHEDPATAVLRNHHCNEESIAHGNALSQARYARLFQPKYMKFCASSTEVAPQCCNALTSARIATSWWDPRELAHDNSAASFTSTDRDSSGDSSSSRDSSGSSQDCFDGSSKDFHTTGALDNKGFLHNREVFSTHSAHPERSSAISTWLRPPFKWKVLFGTAKKSSTTTSKPSLPPSPYDNMQQRHHSMDALISHSTPDFFSISSVSTDRYYSDCSGELSHSGNLLLSSRVFIHGGEQDKYYHRSMEKAKGYLHRYVKALNPNRSSKDHDGHGGIASDEATHASPAITTSRISPAFSQSFRFSPKDISLRIKRPPQPSPAPSGGLRRTTTSSTSSELQSAIQGAIAHCKESQSRHDQDSK